MGQTKEAVAASIWEIIGGMPLLKPNYIKEVDFK